MLGWCPINFAIAGGGRFLEVGSFLFVACVLDLGCDEVPWWYLSEFFQKVWYRTRARIRTILWHRPPCHTMAQGPCHTPEKVWYKRPCHTMAQVPCHTPQRPSQSQLLYPVPYLRNPVPYPYHTLATLTSAEHILFPHANHTRTIPVPYPRGSRSRAGRTAQP